MKSTLIKYSFAVGFVFFLIACSVKKDKFISRNFHAVTTEYNVLYNGNIALDKGLEELKATYQDNFWEVLPIERTSEKAEITLPEPTKNQNFEGAEEKAVKAIQKHSMNIAGTEKNPQMDEAYLLLAKARYYQNRFIPALEALNYILYKYPLSDRIYHAKVWREKVNIRLDNEDVAIKNLKRLLKDKKIKGQDLADANAMLAQAYMNIQVKDTAIAALKIAKEATNNNEEKARYTFILGQLYENLQYNDSAYSAFQEVIDMNRKSPRRYVIQSHAKQALQFDYKNGDTLVFVEKFNKLLEDRENRPFLDILNHQMGIFVTMNPGYAGRSQLPDNLKQLFRNMAMVKPDKDMIAQVTLYSQGYKTAERLSGKMVSLFDLCSNQLSSQSHYDFGLRALKSVLVNAGNLKRREEKEKKSSGEEVNIAFWEQNILLKSVCDTLIPKLVAEDITLFHSLLTGVFPDAKVEEVKEDLLREKIVELCRLRNLLPEDSFVDKMIQLYSIQNLHHGVMMVGQSGTGKSAAWKVLLEALYLVDGIKGESYIIDPKAVNKDNLYGKLDQTTLDWTDGVFTGTLRKILDNK